MDCLYKYYNLCIIPASSQHHESFFGFAEFISAFALLAIVFTIADIQYRFRISISPMPLPKITFWAIAVIGFGTLATDLWVAQEWLVIYVPFMSYSLIQGLFAATFLFTAMTWLYFAFVKPPVFSKWNAERYAQVLFQYLLKGSDSELPIIAIEVGRSAEKFIDFFAKHEKDFPLQFEQQNRGEKVQVNPGNYASDIMRMIGNRKFCRYVIASAPSTAIQLLQGLSSKNIYNAPIAEFAKNISTEALLNSDSNIYHEDSHYQSGLFGELKPFTQAVYGSYRLVEQLGSRYGLSPLDVEVEFSKKWTASQLEAYSRAVLVTYEDRLRHGAWRERSYSLNRAFDNFKYGCSDLYELDGMDEFDWESHEKLRVCVRFVTDVIELIEKYEDEICINHLKPDESLINHDIFDNVANLMSEIIFNASAVTKPIWPCWSIQHNAVWSRFFDHYNQTKTRKIINFKLRRIIYNEIKVFDQYSTFKSFKAARYLGICLNCMGVILDTKKIKPTSTQALHKVVINWVKKNYISLYDNHQPVAEACLMGSITYEPVKQQLIKTYTSIGGQQPNQEILSL